MLYSPENQYFLQDSESNNKKYKRNLISNYAFPNYFCRYYTFTVKTNITSRPKLFSFGVFILALVILDYIKNIRPLRFLTGPYRGK